MCPKGGGYETAPRDFFRYRRDLFRPRGRQTKQSHSRRAAADAAALQADTSLQLALKKKDAKAVGALLDQQFTWTNEAGQTLTSAQFLRDAAAGTAVGDTEYTDVKARDYGQLAVVTGIGKRTGHAGTFFARIWVKRPAGWLLLTHQDTAILAKAAPSPQAPAAGKGAADCRQAAKIPAAPFPTCQKQRNKKKSSRPIRTWRRRSLPTTRRRGPYHVADEFVGIGRQYVGSPDTKAGRVGQIGIVTNRVVLPKMLLGRVVCLRRCGHHHCRPPAGRRTALSRHSRVGESRRPLAVVSQARDDDRKRHGSIADAPRCERMSEFCHLAESVNGLISGAGLPSLWRV